MAKAKKNSVQGAYKSDHPEYRKYAEKQHRSQPNRTGGESVCAERQRDI